MAVYQMYWAGLLNGPTNHAPLGSTPKMVDDMVMFKEVLKNTPHTFIFILTTDQWRNHYFYQHYPDLKEYVSYEMPYFVTNRNHPGHRRLRLLVLKGKGTDES